MHESISWKGMSDNISTSTATNHTVDAECNEIVTQEVANLGRQYVQDMQQRIPESRRNGTSKVVDKMLRNVWNVGYIKMMMPQACVIQVS